MDRSTRQRKKINYKKFEEPDSDDDFEDCTPPTKRVKKENKKQQHPGSDSDKQQSRTSTERDEKTFNREEQQALTVSVNTETESNKEAVRDRNTNTKTRRNKIEDCSDYSASGESRESSDSDFNGSTLATAVTKKQAKKSKALKSKVTPAAADSMKDVTAKNTRRPIATQPKVLTTPTTPALVVRRTMPKWTPPAPAGSKTASPQVVSGGTPSIRLGLSRNAPTKPLHCKTRPSS